MKDNFILRSEFFGGYLNDCDTQEDWVLDHATTFYLLARNRGIDNENAQAIVSAILNENQPQISYEAMEQFDKLRCCDKLSGNTIGAMIESGQRLLERILRRNYLSFPFEISIYPSFRCNLNCDFCFINSRSKVELFGLQDWLSIISEAKNAGVTSFSILGGEPSVYPYIVPLLSHIESERIRATITMNGQNLSDELVSFLCESK